MFGKRLSKVNMELKINSDIKLILFSLIIIPICSIVSPWLGVMIVAIAALYFMFRNDYCTLLFFVCIAFIQNITLVVAANKFDSATTTLYSLSKEIMLYGCVGVSVVKMLAKKVQMPKWSIMFVSFVFVLVFGFCVSDAAIYAKIVSLRQMLLPFICFCFGKQIPISREELKSVSKYIVAFGVFVGVLGLLEIFVLGDKVWNMLPIWQYQVNKGTTFEFHGQIPLNFITYDLMDFTGKVHRRLVSLFADPLITGHYLFLGFVLSDFCVAKKRKIIKTVLFMCSMLTISKGVFMAYGFYMVFYLLRRVTYRYIKLILVCGMGGLAVLFTAIYNFARIYMPTSSIGIHMNGFIAGITRGTLLGSGLGKAGTITGVLTESADMLTSESYIGTLTAQMGYVGLIIFLLFWACIILQLIRRGKQSRDVLIYNVAILLITIIIESFFSESAIALVGSGLYFMLAGMCVNKQIEQNAVSDCCITQPLQR